MNDDHVMIAALTGKADLLISIVSKYEVLFVPSGT